MTSCALYRTMMLEIERQRLALGLSMAAVDDLAGTQDGYYAKMIYPDTPSGRQAQWSTVDLVVEALFGRECGISLSTSEGFVLSAPRIDKGASSNALKIRHWRHGRHFRELGAKGARSRNDKMTPAQRSKHARKMNRARWRRARKAQLKARARRSEKRSTTQQANESQHP